MYDTIKIVKYIDKPPNEAVSGQINPFYWLNCYWFPIFNSKTRSVVSYYAKADNLKLKLFDRELTITNSLQKFYMGNNYNDFTYQQVKKAISKLENHLSINLKNAEVKKLSFGAVINETPDIQFNNWLEHKGKTPIFMRNSTKIYGAHFKATNYNIKGYNKTFEVENATGLTIPLDLFRFELESNTRFVNNRKYPIGIHTVNDLLDKSKFDTMGSELINTYQNIRMKPYIDYQNLLPKQIRLLTTMANKDASNGLKSFHKETYKKDRISYLKLLKQVSNNNYKQNVLDKIIERVIYCQKN